MIVTGRAGTQQLCLPILRLLKFQYIGLLKIL